jgi:arginine deiminase
MVEGVVLEKNNLTNYLSTDRFSDAPVAQPVFYPRLGHGNERQNADWEMANPVRERETLIMDCHFQPPPDVSKPPC